MRPVAFGIFLTPLMLLMVAWFTPASGANQQATDFMLACLAFSVIMIIFSATLLMQFEKIFSAKNKRDAAFISFQSLPAILAFPAFVMSPWIEVYGLVCLAGLVAIVRADRLTQSL